MGFLVNFVLLVIPFSIIFALMSATGIGAGYLFRWLLGIDLGSAIVSGMVAAGVSLYFVVRLYTSIPSPDDEYDSTEDDEPSVVYLMDPLTRRGKRRRKRK